MAETDDPVAKYQALTFFFFFSLAEWMSGLVGLGKVSGPLRALGSLRYWEKRLVGDA